MKITSISETWKYYFFNSALHCILYAVWPKGAGEGSRRRRSLSSFGAKSEEISVDVTGDQLTMLRDLDEFIITLELDQTFLDYAQARVVGIQEVADKEISRVRREVSGNIIEVEYEDCLDNCHLFGSIEQENSGKSLLRMKRSPRPPGRPGSRVSHYIFKIPKPVSI